MNIRTIGFIGLGLIGGSIAKALRRVHPELQMIAYNQSRESLIAAMEDGTINQATDTLNESFAACDLIFLCAPVSVNIRCLQILKDIIRPDCLLTDVGSVKTTIHEAVDEIGLSRQFIGGHPMAGSEKFRYANASDRLLENAYYILTPGADSSAEHLEAYRDLVASIQAIPIVLDYREHDRATAAISHLPHIIAYALVNLVRRSDNTEGLMRMLAAGGFKDITRIASSSPEMWQQICTENQAQVLQMLDAYQEDLALVEAAIRKEDNAALIKYFDQARIYRNALPESYRGTIQPLPEIYVDVPDETGAISVVSAILAANRLSIKNMGIRNNREVQAGALKIVFENMEAAAKAAEILKKYNYTVYERD